MSAFAAILKADLLGLWNRVRRPGRSSRRLVLIGLVLVFAGGPILGVAFGAGAGLALVAGAEVEPVLAIGLALLATAILLFGLSTAVSSFYADRSLLLLASSPAGPATVFFARLVSSAWANLALAVLFAAAMAGFTLAAGLGPGFFAVAVVLMLAIVLSATAVQVAVLSLVLRAVPAKLARDVANLVTALLTAAVYLSTFGVRRTFVPGARGADLQRQALADLSSAGAGLEWLPTSLPARALAEWASRGPAASLPWLAASLGVAALLLGVALLSYRAAFATGVGTYAEGSGLIRRRRPRAAEAEEVRSGAARPLPALVAKDWKSLRRDTRRLARALPSLLIALGYPVYFALFRDGRVEGSGFWGSLIGIWFAPFILSQMLGLTAVASEGRAFLMLRQAPLSMAAFLRSKLAFAVPPTAGVSLVAGLLVSLLSRQAPPTVLLSSVGMAILGAGMGVVAVCGGALSPDFEAADPRRAVGTLGSVVAVFGQLVFAALAGGGAVGIGLALTLKTSWAPALAALGVVLLAAAAAALVVLAVIAVERLRRWEG